MSPEEAIDEYIRRVWEPGSKDNPWVVVKETLLKSLKVNPDSKELLAEIAIFHEVITEEWELALSYFNKVKFEDDVDVVFHKSRCLAQLGRTQEAISVIESSGHKLSAELVKLKGEILDNEWKEYGDLTRKYGKQT